MSIESMISSNHLILCCPLLLLPSVFPSIRVFSNELALHVWWLKYWSFSFSITPSIIEGLISFRSDWFDLLAVQGTLKSLLQHHGSKVNTGPCQIRFIPLSNNIYRMTPHGGSKHPATDSMRILQYFYICFYPKEKIKKTLNMPICLNVYPRTHIAIKFRIEMYSYISNQHNDECNP